MSTAWPAIRMYRLKTSEGTPNPATWPMWRGPLAYGQATADRTLLMSGDPMVRVACSAHGADAEDEQGTEDAQQPGRGVQPPVPGHGDQSTGQHRPEHLRTDRADVHDAQVLRAVIRVGQHRCHQRLVDRHERAVPGTDQGRAHQGSV